MAAVEATVKTMDSKFDKGTRDALQYLTAVRLMATALASGDVKSVRDVLKKKGLDQSVRTALRTLQISQSRVRGSEAERDGMMPKFVGMVALLFSSL